MDKKALLVTFTSTRLGTHPLLVRHHFVAKQCQEMNCMDILQCASIFQLVGGELILKQLTWLGSTSDSVSLVKCKSHQSPSFRN